jgi:hypothetical protein
MSPMLVKKAWAAFRKRWRLALRSGVSITAATAIS